MSEIIFEIEALTDNLPNVLEYIDSELEKMDCPFKVQMQIDIAVEEIFVNIASYAYAPDTGKATIKIVSDTDEPQVKIIFIDQGVPYDPLKKQDPDVTLSADEREIGGLGIFMVKKSMDDMFYEYKDGQNILTIVKKL
ncbi:Anti-sigma regulatory factor (Ser/Thr protein kinase) [Lachnospiraceae bacterium NE2001]|nr:Anti-sigma regulatory factor (Ser/Thr protein kinase) [Lachnospiraceae bacterium NE2001]